jgi:hypothetical protein
LKDLDDDNVDSNLDDFVTVVDIPLLFEEQQRWMALVAAVGVAVENLRLKANIFAKNNSTQKNNFLLMRAG